MSEETPTSRVEVAVRRTGETDFSAPIPVSGPGLPVEPDVAVAPDGTVTVIWTEWTSSEKNESLVRLATMPAGSNDFGEPETLSDTGIHYSPPRVAAGPGGRALAVWDRDMRDGESRILLAIRTDPSSEFLIQEFPREEDREGLGRPCFPNVVVGRNGEVVLAWNGLGRHWVFQDSNAGPQDWSRVGSVATEGPYGTVLHPDGLVIFTTWDGIPPDDPDEEDKGLWGIGEIGLCWRDASGNDPERNGRQMIIEAEHVEGPVAALGLDGTLALVFREFYDLKVAAWSPGQKWSDRPELVTLEPNDETYDPSAQLLVGPDGAMTVVWIAGPESRGTSVVAATRPSSSEGFEESRGLAMVPGERVVRELNATCDDSGTITASWWEGEWIGIQGEHQRRGDTVFTATRLAGAGQFEDPTEIKGISGKVKHISMATSPDGTTAMVWTVTEEGD